MKQFIYENITIPMATDTDVTLLKTREALLSAGKKYNFTEELCEYCDDPKPLDHFQFVDGIVFESSTKQGVMFFGMTSCKDWMEEE